MKKVITLACALVMLMALSGCNIIKFFTSSPEERVEQWVARQQSDFEQLNKQYEGTAEYSLTAEGHDVILTIRYPFITTDDGETKKAMAASMNSSLGDYAEMYRNLRDTVADPEVRLILRYFNSAGEVLAEGVMDAETAATATGRSVDGSSLEAFIMSESFQTAIAAGSFDKMTFSALVEDGVVVVLYTFTEEIDRTNIEELRIAWEQYLSGEEAAGYINMLMMLKQKYPEQTKGLKVRITDPTGDTLFEYEYQQ